MEIKGSFTKRKCLRTKATGIHYKMHEIKPIYCSLNSPTRRHGYGFYRRKLGLETHVK
jgi:hypothetical protein